VGHLDLAREWERAFQQAGIALSYSEGNKPRPRITVAAGLPSGATSDGELLDAVLARHTRADEVVDRVQPHLPPGLTARDAREVGMGLPSLPTAVRWADYEVEVPAGAGADVRARIASFLAAHEFPWEDTRGEKTRHYDLRALVQELAIDGECAGEVCLKMRLRCDSTGVGRPDQVVLALGLPQATRTHRLRLVLAEVSPARDAWRRRGRFLA
jgi:radical SAM-linked protein